MRATGGTLHQAGVIAYRVVGGEVRVLLLTSRDTGRWVIPKGNIAANATPADAAIREAYEEAGVRGTIVGSVPLGLFQYSKRLAGGGNVAAMVEVYLLRVEQSCKKFPERGERKYRWVTALEAARMVDEPGLGRLFARVLEIEAVA